MTIGALEFLFEAQPWQKHSACKDADPSLFILEQGQSARKGKEFCAVCPVKVECLAYGRLTGSVGLWGGVVLSWRRTPTPFAEIQDARPIPLKAPKRRRSSGGPPAPGRLPMAARKQTG